MPTERILLPDEEMERIRAENQMKERKINETLTVWRTKRKAVALGQVERMIDTYFFNEFLRQNIMVSESLSGEPKCN